MATRRSREKHEFDDAVDGCQPGHVTWEYNTTSDTLVVDFNYQATSSWGGELKPYTKIHHFGSSEASALYYALKEWMEQ